MTITTVAVDLGKNRFDLVGLDEREQIELRRTSGRGGLMRLLGKLGPCRVAMEACAGAHHIARKAEAMGHYAVLLPGQYVKPYAKRQKNDQRDAEAIAEAASRPRMATVPAKSVEQHEIQMMHRVREGWIGMRTAICNQIRGHLMEVGIVLAQGRATVRRRLPEVLEDGDNELTDGMRAMLWQLWCQMDELDARLAEMDRRLSELAHRDPRARRLLSIPGIGPVIATALIGAVADAGVFKRGRHFAAWLGLVPRQHTTGGQCRLGAITKRGDRYLRTLLIHGARSVLRLAHRKDDRLHRWAARLAQRRPSGKAQVALANKLARIVWAVLAKDEAFRPQVAAA